MFHGSDPGREGFPTYLAVIIDLAAIVAERRLWHDTDGGAQEYVVHAGVTQGFILGPVLWNMMCSDTLKFPLPEKATVVGYADEVALVVVAKDLQDAELYSGEVISAAKVWLEGSNLTLTEEKARAIL